MPEPTETTRFGRPYFICPKCPWSGFDHDSVAAHMHDHDEHPTLDDLLNPPASPEPRKRKE